MVVRGHQNPPHYYCHLLLIGNHYWGQAKNKEIDVPCMGCIRSGTYD